MTTKTTKTKAAPAKVKAAAKANGNMARAGNGKAAKAAPKGKAVAAKAKPLGQRVAILQAAEAGQLPPVPDFSAPTHARFRAKLAAVVDLVAQGDIAGLKGFQIKPISTSPKAIDRYRNLAVIALQARARP
jgi:hypothetical protein